MFSWRGIAPPKLPKRKFYFHTTRKNALQSIRLIPRREDALQTDDVVHPEERLHVVVGLAAAGYAHNHADARSKHGRGGCRAAVDRIAVRAGRPGAVGRGEGI